MDPYLDFYNLMAYDFAGSWDSTAGHQANLFPSHKNPASTPFNAEYAVKYYVSQGVHPRKIVLGMPIYGRAFENSDGPGKPYSGVGQGTWEAGVYDYKALPLPGAEEKYDHEVGGSYSYDATKRMMVSYDTAEVAREKAEYVKRGKLGGAMWWESSADKPGSASLIGNVVECLGGHGGREMERSENCLDYPQSKYDNVKKGFPGE
jgi:chitinase